MSINPSQRMLEQPSGLAFVDQKLRPRKRCVPFLVGWVQMAKKIALKNRPFVELAQNLERSNMALRKGVWSARALFATYSFLSGLVYRQSAPRRLGVLLGRSGV